MIFSGFRFENLLKSKYVAGVEIILSPSGVKHIHYVILKNQKNRLIIDSFGINVESIEVLIQKIPSSYPLLISFNGKGIIHKRLSYTENENESSLLNKVLPAAHAADFYLQRNKSDELNQTVSIIRKTTVDILLEGLKKSRYHVIGCYLGPFLFQSIMPLLDDTLTLRDVYVSDFKLSLGQSEIIQFESIEGAANSTIKLISSEGIAPELVVSFCSAMQYFISSTNNSLYVPAVIEENKDFRRKQFFTYAVGGAIIVFVIALLVNFFLFNYFSSRYNEYHTQVSANQNMVFRYEKMQKEVEQKQKFLEETGLLESSRISYYADQIAKSLPTTILLTHMSIFPLEKKSNTDEQDMTFKPKIIFIAGNCNQSIELNEWMGNLKRQVWIGDVSVINFSQDKSERTGSFSIEIKIK
jgi:Tfp pilus assembly protein PilN